MNKNLLIVFVCIIFVAILLLSSKLADDKYHLRDPRIKPSSKLELSQKKTVLSFMPNWYSGAQFSGYYYAEHYKIYESFNLDVNILRFDNDYDVLGHLIAGELDVAVMSMNYFTDACKQTDQIVVLAAIFQYEPSVFIVKENSGIECPTDFKEKKIICKNKDWKRMIYRIISTAGLDSSQVELVYGQNDLAAFTSGDIDIWAGYAHNEPVEFDMAGIETSNIYAYDYGVINYEGLLVTTRDLLEHNSDAVESFLSASMIGWDNSIKNPELTLKAIQCFDSSISISFQRQSLAKIVPFIHTGEKPLGCVDISRWNSLMGENGLEDESYLAIDLINKIHSKQY
ncbi:ABC transporter substrate-binding protein [bacterium]|nr:ABC transporter substrate-binding protein [bacterium]